MGFVGLHPFQWIVLILAAMTLALLGDAFAGHSRSGFTSRAQYAPFISGGLLITSAAAAAVAPGVRWLNIVLYGAGWLAVVSGLIGLGFHHYYGIAKKPGGYRWLLHYLMYGAPQLAPVALAAMGMLGIISARGLAGEASIAGLSPRVVLLGFVAVTLAGAILQASVLHYRGAFNNVVMYAPMTAPLLAAAASLWAAFAPGDSVLVTLKLFLWLTLFTGFVGLGMHLRGFDRQMGGLYVAAFNLLEGPPAWAPVLFAGLAGVGLVTIYLL
jgi:hypothetical protein